MAGPITWRTVNGPSLAEAGRPMESAQRSFDNAFTGLTDVLKQREAVDTTNWNQLKENNTQDFLNKLYSAQGAEGFKALQDSGELQRMLTANGAQIDRAAARSAMDGRLSVLQQRDKQAGEFSDWTTTREQRPIVNGIMTDIYRGNTDKAAATLASNPDLLNAPEIQKTLTDYKRKLVEEGRDDTRWTWNQEEQKWKVAAEDHKADLRPYEVQLAQLAPRAKQAEIRASNASADASVARAAADRDAVNFRAQERLEQKLTTINAKIAELADSTKPLGSAGGQESVIKVITANIKDEAIRARLIATLPGLVSKPEFASAPAGVVATALLSDINTGFWGSPGNNVASKLTQLLKNTSSSQSKDIEDSLTVFRQQRDVLRKELGYGGGDSAAPAPAPGPSPTPALATAPEPSKPAPTREAPPSVFNAGQAAELVRQRTELEKGVRKAFSPEIQTLLEKDKVQGQAFQATVAKRKADEETALSKKREELSKSLGIEVVAKPAPWTPSNAGWAPATSPRFGSQINNLQAFAERQKKYENWVEAIDARLGAEAKKAK